MATKITALMLVMTRNEIGEKKLLNDFVYEGMKNLVMLPALSVLFCFVATLLGALVVVFRTPSNKLSALKEELG